jgi:hypothetical protein
MEYVKRTCTMACKTPLVPPNHLTDLKLVTRLHQKLINVRAALAIV